MVIVLAIDKDNDYGRKAGVKCPVIGRDNVLRAVVALGLADPEDSDVNVGFAALKIAEEVGGVPVIVCGEGKNTFRDDLEVCRQLDAVRGALGDSDVIIVTDGAEDESVVPVVSSRFRVVGVERVTVKQLEGVETVYYIIVKYLKEILSSKEMSKLFLGVPGLVLLLMGLSIIVSTWHPGFYSAVKNSIIGFGLLLFGGYIFKIGFGVDFRRLLRKDFITMSSYVMALFAIAVGGIRVYQLYSLGLGVVYMMEYGVRSVFIALAIYVIGKAVSDYLNGRKRLYYYLSFLAFIPVMYCGVLLIMRYVFRGYVDVFCVLVAVVFFAVSAALFGRRAS